jgi:uncharacterized protein with NRDE domain
LLALAKHPRYAVVIAANRDEYHARPTAPARWWDEGWLAGRDLTAGGTWLGVTRKGRWALVTNVREPGRQDQQAPSRGALVLRLLEDTSPVAQRLRTILADGNRYNGYNLLAGDAESAYWGSNRGPHYRPLVPGVYGLSNLQLDTPWPKVRHTKEAFARWCAEGESDDRQGVETLFGMLADSTRAPDAELPVTGVGVERERLLSAPFIVSASYGTRSSTLLTIGYDREIHLVERSFNADGQPIGEVDFRLPLTAAVTAPARTRERTQNNSPSNHRPQ